MKTCKVFGKTFLWSPNYQLLSRKRPRKRLQECCLRDYIYNCFFLNRDRWNIFDLLILFIFFCAIFPLRIVTWTASESASNNQALEIAGYLYGFNTMFLTLRVFGSILESFEGVGTIQIAFFYIIRDAVVVVVHFFVITLAFSSTITKIFVVETSILKEETKKHS